MFDFIRIRRAKKEFQNKYKLSNDEMLCIVFNKSVENTMVKLSEMFGILDCIRKLLN